jgi:hypothetical protein
MANVYTWTVTAMDCYPQADGQTDVVFTVHWACAGTDGTYNASVYNTCPVTYTAGSPYTPYANLTQDQVLGWIWADGVDKAVTEATVGQLIENQVSPPVVSPPLPWANS